MTLHAAKGLEFETVFLPGWEEGLFPHQRALDEGGRSGLEEERRLAYVGLTRAKRHCHIWFVSNRRIHGLWQNTVPSRFLDELPDRPCRCRRAGIELWRLRLLRRLALRQGRTVRRRNRSSPGWQRAQQNRSRATARTGARAPATRSNASAMARRIRLRRARLGEKPRHRGRTRRQVGLRHPVRLHGRRPRLSPEIRQRQHRLHRRQQAHHRFRQGRPEAGAGRVCGAGDPTPALFPTPPPGNPRISPHAGRRRPCCSARSWRSRAVAGSRAGRRGCARCRAGSRLPSPRPPSR
jgi:ATP-dependent exoDNAse (exonuclease V) beta subunit